MVSLAKLQALNLHEAASVYPVTLAEAKTHLRVDHSDEDALISSLIAAATSHVEGRAGYTGRALVSQVWDYSLASFPQEGFINIPLPPLMEVISVTYLDKDGATQTLGIDYYEVNTFTQPARIHLAYGKSWPETYEAWNAVTIRFRAGYAPTDSDSPTDMASGVPESIKAAILLIIGDLYHNRQAQQDAKLELNRSVQALLYPYRVNIGL